MHTPQIAHTRDNNAMHAKSGLRVVLEWEIYRPDSVIADVIRLNREFSGKTERHATNNVETPRAS